VTVVPKEPHPKALDEDVPRTPSNFNDLLRFVLDDVIPLSLNTLSPGHLGYIPGGGLIHTAIADLIIASMNRHVGVWSVSPGLVEMEHVVVRWFAKLIGLPAHAGGVLTSGGSLANFSAVLTARTARLPEDFLSGTIYVSEQAHHSLDKAARMAGFPAKNVRRVPTGADFRIDLDALRALIAADRRAGLSPFLLVGTAGTTNSGAVDDLAGLAALASEEQLWLHVDAAYGGCFVLTARGRALLTGIENADSVTIDPHKGLFLSYGTGCLLVRDLELLRRAHDAHDDYMPGRAEAHLNPCDLSPELSRNQRGLRVWLPLKMHGIGAFGSALDEKLDLARFAADELMGMRGIELVAKPQLSTVVFRLVGSDAQNHLLLERINAERRVQLTGTIIGGRFVIRLCVLSFRTHLDRVLECLQSIRAAVASLTEAPADVDLRAFPRFLGTEKSQAVQW